MLNDFIDFTWSPAESLLKLYATINDKTFIQQLGL